MVVTTMKKAARRGFTLVELVIVVLVIGIIAAIAAPKMFDTAGDARRNATQQSLRTLRSAIELYRAQNGTYPPAASLTTALRANLQGNFPSPQIGSRQTATVAEATGGSPISGPSASGDDGWIYNATTGEIRVNDAAGFTW
jgi:general secretion pathway protein G